MGAAGGAGVLRSVGAGMSTRALRPCRLRLVGGLVPATVIGAGARAARGGRRDPRRGTVRSDGHVDGRAGCGGVGGGASRDRSAPGALRRMGARRRAVSAHRSGPRLGAHRVALGPGLRRVDRHLRPRRRRRDAGRARSLPAGLFERGHRSGVARAELRARRQRPARRGADPDVGGAPRRRSRRTRSRRASRSPPASAVPSWCGCPDDRTSRTPAIATSWCAWSGGSSASRHHGGGPT